MEKSERQRKGEDKGKKMMKKIEEKWNMEKQAKKERNLTMDLFYLKIPPAFQQNEEVQKNSDV